MSLHYSVPLNGSDPKKRQFILFDEQFTISLWREPDEANHEQEKETRSNITLNTFTVWINEAIMIQDPVLKWFDQIDADTWSLKENICQEYLFRSSVVMNNGYDNIVRFQITYSKGPQNETPIVQEPFEEETQDFLPSFEPMYTWQNNTSGSVSKDMEILHKAPSIENQEVEKDEQENRTTFTHFKVEFQYPVYSLLNMRLRNSNLKSQYCILTSLDFQTSRSLIQLSEKYDIPLKRIHLTFDVVKLELINKSHYDEKSHIEVPSMEMNINESSFQFPFTALPHDSFSMTYKLPPLTADDATGDNDNIDMKPHRVRITLKYQAHLENKSGTKLTFHIITRWETDVTIKRKSHCGLMGHLKPTAPTIGNGVLLNNNATLSRISTISISSTARFNSSTMTNTQQNRLSGYKQGVSTSSTYGNTPSSHNNNVKFKFMNDTMVVKSGDKFTIRLQITNMSSKPLDLVIYYNNQTPTAQSTNSVASTIVPLQTLEKKALWIQRQRKIAEGLILLSNDYKVPLIDPHESYFVDLSLVAIRSGYYSTLNALKLLDLKTQECIEIGRAVSVLVQ